MTSTLVAAATPPSGPRPPDSRLRWHILVSITGTVLSAAIMWATGAVEHTALAGGVAALCCLVWALASSQSSLGYLVPAVVVGVAALVHHHFIQTPFVGDYLLQASTGVLVAIAFGLAVALHYARRDGSNKVRRDEMAAAVHSSHAPDSTLRTHILAGGLALILAGLSYWLAQVLAHPWNVGVSLLLIAAAAALGALSSFAPVLAGIGAAALSVVHLYRAEEPRALILAALLLVAGSLACRLARRSGMRHERRERAANRG